MPFAGFKDFKDCINKVKERNQKYTDEQAAGVCAVIEKRWKEKYGDEK